MAHLKVWLGKWGMACETITFTTKGAAYMYKSAAWTAWKTY